jgi:hypothetical protein
MKKEFVPYEEALALKELGFDEPCVFYVNKNNESFIYNFQTHPDEFIEWCGGNVIKAPTFSQAFRWFREKHNLRSFVDTRVADVDKPYQWIYDYQVKTGNGITTEPYFSEDFKSYEEAELVCLKKLIELVKSN